MKTPAGKKIVQELKDRGWSQQMLAQIMGRPVPTINGIISGKKVISAETAIQLEAVFDIPAQDWLTMNSDYQLRLAMLDAPDTEVIRKRSRLFGSAPIREMQKRGWIKKTKEIDSLQESLDKFFISDLTIFTRRSEGDVPITNQQRAWCYRAAQLAAKLQTPKFTDTSFKEGIRKLKKLTVWPEECRKVPKVLSEMGIKFVVVEPIAKTKIDGAAFWLKDQPVICLSLRFDRIDSFWHTLGHELSHIVHRDPCRVDVKLVGEDRAHLEDSIERRADAESAAMWINQKSLDDFCVRVSPLFSRARINQFASRIKVHPGIVVGQLQHRKKISYATYRQSLAKVRDLVADVAITDGWGHSTNVF